MSKVFISYGHAAPDQQLAAELARFLEGNGLAVFADTKIRIGQEWVDEIDRHLRSADHFVVLLSSESIRSDMLRREVALAHTLHRQKKLRVFPVRVAFDGELPYDLGAYLDLIQYERWNPGEPFDPICRAILQAIQAPGVPDEYGANDAAPPPAAPDSVHGRGGAPSMKSPGEPDLERLENELAVYVGPMAKIIVARAAKRPGSLRQLYEAVAAEIPSPADRQKFLASRMF
jgi:hypothetical protein